MDAIECILTRRSVRQYTRDPVSDADIEELLIAAMHAPSAGNEQPWHFIVIRDRQILDMIPTVHPYSKMILQAPVAILVCGDLMLEKYSGFWVQDCSAATQNLMLAAHAKGLSTVWLGVYPHGERVEGLSKLLNIPEYVLPLALIPVGWPNEEPRQPDRFDKTRIKYDKWV